MRKGYIKLRYVQVLSVVVLLYIVVFKYFVVPRVDARVDEYKKSKIEGLK